MMPEQTLTLRQRRNVGETLNATFAFVRLHWRVLLTSLVQLVLPNLVVIAGLIVVLLQTYVVGIDTGTTGSATAIAVTILFLLLCVVLFAAAFAIATAVYYAIVRLALQRGTDFDVKDVRPIVRSTVMSLVGLYIFQGILSTVASYAVMLPMTLFIGTGNFELILEAEAVIVLLSVGVQLSFVTYVSCSYAVLAIEKQSIYNSVQRSVKLVRGSFWPTLGLVVIVTIIVYLMMLAPVAHPVLIASILYAIFDPAALSQWILNTSVVVELAGAVYGLFVALCFFFVWMFPTTAIALHYISLVEQKEGVGLAIRVHTLLPPVPEEAPITESVETQDSQQAHADSQDSVSEPTAQQAASVATSDESSDPGSGGQEPSSTDGDDATT